MKSLLLIIESETEKLNQIKVNIQTEIAILEKAKIEHENYLFSCCYYRHLFTANAQSPQQCISSEFYRQSALSILKPSLTCLTNLCEIESQNLYF